MLQKIKETAEWIKQHTASRPTTAIVLGTGLGRLAAEIDIIDAFPYDTIPNFPVSTVEGHSGRLLFGKLGDREVMALEGRFHYYEGYDMKTVTFPIRVMYELGIGKLFVSNAAISCSSATISISCLNTPCMARTFPQVPVFLT